MPSGYFFSYANLLCGRILSQNDICKQSLQNSRMQRLPVALQQNHSIRIPVEYSYYAKKEMPPERRFLLLLSIYYAPKKFI
jgi:hypothetical protein